MRKFTPKETEFLKKIVELKENCNLQELQLMRLLRKQLDTLAIRWNLEPKCSIQIYAEFENPTEEQWEEVKKKYFEVADYIYLIEELLEYKLVKLQEISFENPIQYNDRVLYDRDKYQIEGDFIFEKSNKDNCLYALSDIGKHKVNVTFARDLEKYANYIIYPLPLLKDLKENDFLSINERRHNEQNCTAWMGIIAAIGIGIASPFISKWISEKSDKESIEQVISAIKEQKSISIDKFPNILPDTLNVKVADTPNKQPINLNVIVKENQPTKIQ